MIRAWRHLTACTALVFVVAGMAPALAKVEAGLARTTPPAARDGSLTAQAQPPAGAAQQAAPAPAAPPVPTRTEIQNFDFWAVTCHDYATGPRKRVCFAQLRVAQEESKQVVLIWTVGYDAENNPVTELQTPTGVSIPPGVEVKLSGGEPRKVAFATCNTGRCTANIPLDEALIRDLSNSETAEITFQASNGTAMQFSFAVDGFEKAYAALNQ